jgi:LacI family transcriptional regulator
VAKNTRDRVLGAAHDLGYSPSALARALVTRKSRIIGVIVGDIIDPYFAEVARGVEDVAARHEYLTMVCSADWRTSAELERLKALRNYRAAGVVFASSGAVNDPEAAVLTTVVEDMRRQGSVVVTVAPREFDSISAVVDNEAAAHDITEYVISLGHRRIAFVEGPAGLFTSQHRLQGFIRAMQAAGLATDLRYKGGLAYDDGREAALEIVAAGLLPDAVVAANDELAIGVLMTLRQAGVDVPGAVSVVGIDDTRPAHFVELTTVKLPLYELGAVAARSILAEHGETERPEELALAHRLVPRRTSALRQRV